MNPIPSITARGVIRSLAGAAISAGLVATIGLVSSSAAEPVEPPSAGAGAHSSHESMARHWDQHVQAHLDKLAERLEIKASQEAAWQKFSAAFHDTMRMHAMMGHEAMGEADKVAQADAAALARQMADHASARAQKLAQLADATAALQQALSADQRLVFDEAARHFAHEHGGMGPMAEGGHHGGMGGHCERGDPHEEHHGDYGNGHSQAEPGEDGRGSVMESADAGTAPPSSAAH